MKKHLGTKIFSVLVLLGILFVIATLINIRGISGLQGSNATVANYLELAQVKANVAEDTQKIQMYAYLSYYKKYAEDREETVQALADSLKLMESDLAKLKESCELANDADLMDAYNSLETVAGKYIAFCTEFHKDALDGMNAYMVEKLEVMSSYIDPVFAAEETITELLNVKADEAMNRSEASIAQIFSMNGIFIGLTVLVIILSILIVLLTIVHPAKKSGRFLNEIIGKIQNNEGDLTDRIPVKSRDEIGQMSQGINLFLEELQKIMHKLKNESDMMQESVMSVSNGVDDSKNSANNVSAAMEQMSASMEEIAATLTQLSEGSDHVLAEVQQMNGQVNEGVSLVNGIKVRARKMYDSTISGKETTTQLVADIRNELAAAVEESRSVEQIKDLTAEILSIASQTNLLSLNASIEAARAGEAGRGFAVVADEIRQLADGSRDTANNIQQISQMVIGAVDKLSKKAEEALDFIDGKIMKDYDGFVDIVGQYEHDADSVDSIFSGFASDISTITEAVEDMNVGISGISTAVDENAHGITDVAESVGGLVSAIDRIKAETANNQDISERLGDEVKRFKNV